MVTSTIPFPTFGPTGFVSPSQQSILGPIQADIDTIFGGGLNPGLVTSQGQLASSWTATVGNTFDLFCNITQQIDPAFATGRMQDAIGRIYFIARFPAQATIVQALCRGASNLLIPAGSIAKATDGNLYTSTQNGTIGPDGTTTIPFACNTLGPITCPEGSLNAIYRAIPGWDSVTNPQDGVIGRNVESRREFEDRRSQSTAKNSLGSAPSVRGAVLGVDGVLDAFVYDNGNNTPFMIGAVTLPKNSLYVAAVGGTDADVAQAIWTKKGPGCSYYSGGAGTVVTVSVPDTSYDPPYPTYDVSFVRPDSLRILFLVNVQNSPQVPADGAAQIQDAIINAFAGEDGGPRARIGGLIFATRFNAPIAALGAWAQIIELTIGSPNTRIALFTGSIAGTVLTVTAITGTPLAVGQTITGAAIRDGTQIASLGTGVGGVGTYNLTGSAQTVSSRPMSAALADQTKIQVEIDQVPTIAAANIQVILTS